MFDLRARLQEITHTVSIEKQPFAIETIRGEYGHSIHCIDLILPKGNCYEYAFNLDPHLAGWIGSHGITDLFAGEGFVNRLIQHLQEVPESDVEDGDIALYFNDEEVTHAGAMKTKRVISKWGKGHVYGHGLQEVPGNYGDTVRFYRGISRHVANRYFVEYVRKHLDYGAIEDQFEEQFGHVYPCMP
jgi:hypothetical protein